MTAMPALWEFRSRNAADALAQRAAFAQALCDRFGMAVDRTAAEIVFTELVGNVMRHAPGPIEIRLTEGDGATLEVIDSGPGFEFTPKLPPATAECGRGLYIISRLAQQVRTRWRDGKPARVRVTLIAYQNPDAVASSGHASSNGRASHNGMSPEAPSGTSPDMPSGSPNDEL